MSDAEILAYKKEIEAVKAENQKLRMQFLENEQTISSVAAPIMNAETKPSLVQRGPLFIKSGEYFFTIYLLYSHSLNHS
jgi:cell shape-determining protein MreC